MHSVEKCWAIIHKNRWLYSAKHQSRICTKMSVDNFSCRKTICGWKLWKEYGKWLNLCIVFNSFQNYLSDRRFNCGGFGLSSRYVIKWKTNCSALKHNGNLKPDVIRFWVKNKMLLEYKFQNVTIYFEILPSLPCFQGTKSSHPICYFLFCLLCMLSALSAK